MKVKQLRLPIELKDIIFNLSDEDRKKLISELQHKLTWTNYENFQYNQSEYSHVWKYIKNNPKEGEYWIKEIFRTFQ